MGADIRAFFGLVTFDPIARGGPIAFAAGQTFACRRRARFTADQYEPRKRGENNQVFHHLKSPEKRPAPFLCDIAE